MGESNIYVCSSEDFCTFYYPGNCSSCSMCGECRKLRLYLTRTINQMSLTPARSLPPLKYQSRIFISSFSSCSLSIVSNVEQKNIFFTSSMWLMKTLGWPPFWPSQDFIFINVCGKVILYFFYDLVINISPNTFVLLLVIKEFSKGGAITKNYF